MLMVIGALLVVGLVSWTRLGVDLLPALDFPIVVVTTVYPGASPEAVDTLVTKQGRRCRRQHQRHRLHPVQLASRASRASSSSSPTRPPRTARSTSSGASAPSAASCRPTPRTRRSASTTPTPSRSCSSRVSGNRDLGALQRLAEDKIQKRLEGTNGVAQVSLVGGLVREIQVQVDQQQLQARGLSILQVNQALAGDNLNVPAGSITQQGKDWTVRLDNQAQTPDELNNILVALDRQRSGLPARRGDGRRHVQEGQQRPAHQRPIGARHHRPQAGERQHRRDRRRRQEDDRRSSSPSCRPTSRSRSRQRRLGLHPQQPARTCSTS